MILSDFDIAKAMKAGLIKIEPFDADSQLQAVNVDLRLSPNFTFPDYYDENEEHVFERFGEVGIPPNIRVHAQTQEWVELAPCVAGYIYNRSTWDRKGLQVNAGSILVPPGWKGRFTLELFNRGRREVLVPINARICTIVFQWTTSPVTFPYGTMGSHYQGQSTPRGADDDARY